MVRFLRPFVFVAICAVLTLAQAPEAQGGKGKKGKGKHPHIQNAITALGKAKTQLQDAGHDFGGHKVSAIGAVDAALLELNAALMFADGKGKGKGKKK